MKRRLKSFLRILEMNWNLNVLTMTTDLVERLAHLLPRSMKCEGRFYRWLFLKQSNKKSSLRFPLVGNILKFKFPTFIFISTWQFSVKHEYLFMWRRILENMETRSILRWSIHGFTNFTIFRVQFVLRLDHNY